jgi:hypothetical protein
MNKNLIWLENQLSQSKQKSNIIVLEDFNFETQTLKISLMFLKALELENKKSLLCWWKYR